MLLRSVSLLALLVASTHAQCLLTTNALRVAEALVDDVSVVRSYQLCANVTVGRLSWATQRVTDGQDMLHLRPNVHISCQEPGTCVLSGGDVLVDGTDYFGFGMERLDNVVVKGMVFEDAGMHGVWLNKPGDVTFKDCIFRNSSVLADYYDPLTPNTELEVVFEDCVLEDYEFHWTEQAAMVVGNGRQNRLVFRESRFVDNDMVLNNTKVGWLGVLMWLFCWWVRTLTSSSLQYDRDSFLIASHGPVSLLHNCFENNKVGVSPLALYHEENFLINNYESFSRGLKCPLASRYESMVQVDNNIPTCESFDANTCLVGSLTIVPSAAPTPAPTVGPTRIPSAAPSTSGPTTTPSVGPTHVPTGAPTPGPTSAPSSPPTRGPTTPPSSGPTVLPSSLPTLPPSGAPRVTSLWWLLLLAGPWFLFAR